MLTLVALTLALLSAAPDRPPVRLESPAGAYFLAMTDLLLNVPAAKRDRTRYLALYAVPPDDRAHFLETAAFWVASLTYRRDPPRPRVTGDGLLLRLDLYDCEWDRQSRAERKAQFTASGVTFAAGEVSEDPWEVLAAKDPFFGYTKDGERGWVDPAVAYPVYQMTGSAKAVLRADWFLARTATDRPDGHYSDFLMLPSNEADLYRTLLIDEANVRLRSLAVGGATKAGTSVVALEPRGLELLRGPYGDLWRTSDHSSKKVIGDRDGKRNPRRTLLGQTERDGREIIWQLPSGLSGYYAANGQGKQVADVPPDVAIDQRKEASPGEPIPQRVVSNGGKCVDCHGRESGTIGFQDSVTAQMVHAPNSGLLSYGKDPHAVEVERRKAEDYYLEHHAPRVRAMKAAYEDALFKVNGLKPADNAKQFLGFLNRYSYGTVGRADAAREFGVDPDGIKPFLKASGDPDLLFLVDDEPVTRAQFETSFAAGMRGAPPYPWETNP